MDKESSIKRSSSGFVNSYFAFTFFYAVVIYVFAISFFFWLWRKDIRPEN